MKNNLVHLKLCTSHSKSHGVYFYLSLWACLATVNRDIKKMMEEKGGVRKHKPWIKHLSGLEVDAGCVGDEKPNVLHLHQSLTTIMGCLHVGMQPDLPRWLSCGSVTFPEAAGNDAGVTVPQILQGDWESSQPWTGYSSQVNCHWLFALHVPVCCPLYPAEVAVLCLYPCVCVCVYETERDKAHRRP